MSTTIEGTINMPVRQLDELRNRIEDLVNTVKNLENQNKDLESKQKQVKLTATIYDSGYRVAGMSKWQAIASGFISKEELERITARDIYTDIKTKELFLTKNEYINLSEIQEDIRLEEKQKVNTELINFEHQINSLNEKNRQLRKNQIEQLNQTKEEYQTQITKLEQEIAELRNEAIEKGKDDQIADLIKTVDQLKSELQAEKSKSFFKKLFS